MRTAVTLDAAAMNASVDTCHDASLAWRCRLLRDAFASKRYTLENWAAGYEMTCWQTSGRG
jgi:hypothetical protein